MALWLVANAFGVVGFPRWDYAAYTIVWRNEGGQLIVSLTQGPFLLRGRRAA